MAQRNRFGRRERDFVLSLQGAALHSRFANKSVDLAGELELRAAALAEGFGQENDHRLQLRVVLAGDCAGYIAKECNVALLAVSVFVVDDVDCVGDRGVLNRSTRYYRALENMQLSCVDRGFLTFHQPRMPKAMPLCINERGQPAFRCSTGSVCTPRCG